jgi:putative tricarboxylic transport membrane protein
MTVLVLSLVGSYTQNYQVSDTLIAVFFAILGRIMLRNDIPGFPLVIGLVLGPLLENRTMQALALTNGDPLVFATRPIAAVLLAVSLIGIAYFLYHLIGDTRRRWVASGRPPARQAGHPNES